MNVRTRFAPSPTGSLHVGNARIAVLNWLFARRHGGEFVLRIEDTDEDRTVPGAETQMLEDLRWLGLEWDEGPGVEGPDGEGPHFPYRQSERGPLYRDHADRLVEAGLAYPCYCTLEELTLRREEALARGVAPHYAGTCRELDEEDRLRLEREGRRAALRFRVPKGETVVIEDAVRGEVRVQSSEIGDFVLLRSDGEPTYNFAVVVDDAEMRITHVIRGVGHLSNTPRQQLLYEAFGYEPPVFVHVPTVLGPDRQKLSKRHGAKPVTDYRREGFHPDAIVNYLSLLSWSSPSEDEFLTRERLINEISLDRVRAGDVVFDEGKMRWLSARHIDRLGTEALAGVVESYIDKERFPVADESMPIIVDAIRSHLSTYGEVNDHLEAFVPTLDEAGLEARAALLEDEAAREVIRHVDAALDTIGEWSPEAVNEAVRSAGREVGARGRALFEPIRIALTGRAHGPPIGAVISVLGRAETHRLLEELAKE